MFRGGALPQDAPCAETSPRPTSPPSASRIVPLVPPSKVRRFILRIVLVHERRDHFPGSERLVGMIRACAGFALFRGAAFAVLFLVFLEESVG